MTASGDPDMIVAATGDEQDERGANQIDGKSKKDKTTHIRIIQP
jgi:hypothetical protein